MQLCHEDVLFKNWFLGKIRFYLNLVLEKGVDVTVYKLAMRLFCCTQGGEIYSEGALVFSISNSDTG